MAAAPTFQALSDVQHWLGTLAAGNSVTLSTANFVPPIAGRVLSVLVGTDPLDLTVTTATATGIDGTLVGTTTVLGEAACTITLSFSADTDDPLLLAIEVDLPSGYVWTPISGFNFGFGGLTATVTPDADVGSANFGYTGKLVVNGEPALAVALTLPAVPGADWTLLASGTTKPSEALLTALSGGQDPLAIFGKDFGLESFTLSQFRMAFSPSGSVSSFAFGLAYHTSWQPFGTSLFEVTGFEFDLSAHKPFDAGSFEGMATAMTKIDDVPINVSVKFPEAAIFAYLDASASLSVTKVFSGFQLQLPTGFPDIEISVLSFGIYAQDQAIDFTLGIDKPIPITDHVHFDAFHFDLGIAYQNSQFSGHGNLFAQFSFGTSNPALVALQGSYDTSGSLALEGSVSNLAVGSVIDSLVAQFGVDPNEVPGAISNLTLDLLKVSFARTNGTDSFRFLCTGYTEVAGVKVQFAPFLSVTYDETSKEWTLDVGGTLDFVDVDGTIEFKVEFVKSKADTSLTATYTSTVPLTFARLAGSFGIDIAGVPPDLDLDLVGLGLSYDFTHGTLVVGAASANKNYGKATFLSQAPSQSQRNRQNIFLLKTGVELSLSQLPLVGSELAKIGTLALTDLAAAIASPAPVTKGAVDTLNQSIAKLGGTYPTVPKDGLAGRLLLAANLELGGIPPQPVSVSLLPPSSAATGALAAPAPGAAAAASGGLTAWFDVQKSFGPVSIQKVGLRYASGKLWALMNADLKAGPVDIGVIGLAVGSPLSTFQPAFGMDGITLSVDAGPFQFSGALVGQLDPLDLYGEIGLSFPGFSIGALAGYAEYQGHPSCFLYAVLNAELGGPAFFFVTGLAAGFGFNRTLVIPPVGQLAQFPLISWATGGGPSSTPTGDVGGQVRNAMAELAQSGVIAPSIGEYWIAAGVQFTSFKLIDSFALLTVKLGNEVEVDLLGLSTLSLPPDDPEPLAMAQLALQASFAPARQEISVMGQLTPASFVLSKSCHLTGGFAFCMWYGGPHAGDFVVSLGGYSPRFDKPSHYPSVPRLGLNWQISDNLSVSGDEYFALTPSAVMAGGGLQATWSSGAIRAWFSVEADFLLLFNPLHYFISASIELGASVKIDLWFTSFTISIHIGAEAEFWGPSFAGKIHVDLDIVSFTISVNDHEPTPPDPIAWGDFVTQVLPSNSKSPPPRQAARLARSAGLTLAATATTDTPALVQINAPTGVLQTLPPVPGAALPLDWLVDGETLVVNVTSTVPLNAHQFSDDGNLTLTADPNDAGKPNLCIGVGPSGIDPANLTSKLTISAKSSVDEGAVIYATQVLTGVPKAVWKNRQLDSNGVPTGVDPMNGTTIDDALTGYALRPQTPTAQASLEIPIEFLEFTNAGAQVPLAWSTASVPASDPFTTQTVHDTIAGALATDNRATLIAAINTAGFSVGTSVDVSSLANAASGALLWTPKLRYLGEAR